MPELPEVEIVRRGLERRLPSQEIAEIEILLPRAFQGAAERLVGRSILACHRRGKMLRLALSDDESLLIHLRMTGQMIVVPADGSPREGGGHPSDALHAALPSSHTRIILSFKSGDKVFFNDQRTLGHWKLLPDAALPSEPFLAKLGPEPWDDSLTEKAWLTRLQAHPKMSLKAVLLDQTVIAGIGNIYADEALFLAKLHPQTLPTDLSKAQSKALLKSVREVLERGLAYGGVSTRNYVNAEGLKGRMQEQLYVYGRKGLPCKDCGTPLVTLRLAGRCTQFCPTCQPRPHEKTGIHLYLTEQP